MKTNLEMQKNNLITRQSGQGKETQLSTRGRRQLHQLLLTATVGATMIATPQVARAAFSGGPPNYTASGAETTSQWLGGGTNTTVTTNPGFSVNVAPSNTGDSLSITGSGTLAYTDSNSSSLTNTSGYVGLRVNSSGDDGQTPGSVTITTNGAISGAGGINAVNGGTGVTSVIASGSVTGTGSQAAVYAENSNALGTGDITVNTTNIGHNNNVISNWYGVQTSNQGNGNTLINVDNITSSQTGIYAQSFGTGGMNITANGTVASTVGDGISAAILGSSTKNLILDVNNVSGVNNGVSARNQGSGTTSITVHGDVHGTANGIFAGSYYPSTGAAINIDIDNTGSVSTTSLSPDGSAIQISGGPATITNDGNITGTVQTDAANDIITNTGTWNSANGTSNFGAGADVFNNNGIFMASNATGTATTMVNGIETVNSNAGSSISMQDGHVGDNTIFTNDGSGVFKANGGTLTIDTNIATQTSDELHVDNVTGGSTGVNVNIVNGLGLPISGDGIRIVDVSGTSSSNAFVLTAPIPTTGLYSYYLNQGQADPSWFLQSAARPEAVATGVLSVLGSRTALSTLSNINDRQRDEKVLLDSADSQKGIWGRVYGQTNDFNTNDSNDFGFNSNLWGAQAGIDLIASGDDTGNRKYGGLYVAYASSSGDARQHGSKVADLDLDATTFGAYYTKYSSSNWYLDAVAQYSRLSGIHARTNSDDISPNGNSYALSLEVGQQFNPESSIVREVQAQIIDQYTDVDDVTLNDGTKLNLSSLNAVTGRVGVRLYGNPRSGKSFLPWLRANIWHTFSGDSTISSLGSSISTPIGGTSGELELGFTKGHAESGGWGIYGSVGYLFDISGAEYSGWKGTLGLRKGL